MIRSSRVRNLNKRVVQKGKIVYWMSRDQRVHDNWALLYAKQLADEYESPMMVVFCLRKSFSYATERTVSFMLDGLQQVEKELRKVNIPFVLLLGDPTDEIPKFVHIHDVKAVVSDFSPLRYNRRWKNTLSQELKIPFYEVDAHNIVPAWIASDKQEFNAFNLRKKIHLHVREFLEEFPSLKPLNHIWPVPPASKTWKVAVDSSVKKVDWIKPGEPNAHDALKDFVSRRLARYASDRNDPVKDAQSELSPYIHFGQISAQRIALEVKHTRAPKDSIDTYLEELIVRRELSDNFCFYNEKYDSFEGFPEWARNDLNHHRGDHREFIYSFEELEQAKTHDDLWNAAQHEMLKRGKMHGYMRMYWAKKILEWTPDPETALRYAIKLNDTYFLDGRDPNGYVGIAWSIGGVHDRPWFTKPIFGKVRYMNYSGASHKFNIQAYIDKVGTMRT